MPLFKTITVSPGTKILIWKITEPFNDLHREIRLADASAARVNGMKSDMHRRGFLCVRKLLQLYGHSDADLYYDPFGKPHLKDGTHLSITHSHEFAAVILSDRNMGVDIEKKRDKIRNIADKFIGSESDYLDTENGETYIESLTKIWGAKESIFKIVNEPGISFKDHISIVKFNTETNFATASLAFAEKVRYFSIGFDAVEDFVLTYAWEN